MFPFSAALQLSAVFIIMYGTQCSYAPTKYKVITIVSSPYVIATNISGKYTGYIIDILDSFKEDGSFDCTLAISPDGIYGDYYANGTMTGLIQAVASGQYDIAAADLTITRNRSKAVDFTRLFTQSSARIAINKNYNLQTVQYYLISDAPLLNFLNKTKLPSVIPIWKNIQSRLPSSIVDSTASIDAVIQRMVKGENIALVGQTIDLVKAIGSNTGTISFFKDTFYTNSYGFAVKFGSSFRRSISQKLYTIAENGYLDGLFQKYFGGRCSVAAPAPLANATTAPSGAVSMFRDYYHPSFQSKTCT